MRNDDGVVVTYINHTLYYFFGSISPVEFIGKFYEHSVLGIKIRSRAPQEPF